MKIASRFAARCPGCGKALPKDPFSGRQEQPWPCRACGAPVCCHCYVGHTAKGEHVRAAVEAGYVDPTFLAWEEAHRHPAG